MQDPVQRAKDILSDSRAALYNTDVHKAAGTSSASHPQQGKPASHGHMKQDIYGVNTHTHMTWHLLPLKASRLHHMLRRICIHVGFLASTQCEAYFTSLMSPSAGSCGRRAAQLKRATLCLPPCSNVLRTVLPALCCFAYMALADLGLGRIGQGRAGQAHCTEALTEQFSGYDLPCPAQPCPALT